MRIHNLLSSTIAALVFSTIGSTIPSWAIPSTIEATKRSEEPIFWRRHLDLGVNLLAHGDFDSARNKFQAALQEAERANDPIEAKAVCYSKIAESYYAQERFVESEISYQTALQIVEKSETSSIKPTIDIELLHADILSQLGAVYRRESKVEQASSSFRKALEIYKSIPNSQRERHKALTDLLSLTMQNSDLTRTHELREELRSVDSIIDGVDLEHPKPIGFFALGYFNDLRTRMSFALQKIEPNERGGVSVSMTIPHRGGTGKVGFISNEILGRYAIEIIQKAEPFPPLPPNSSGDFVVDMHFQFREIYQCGTLASIREVLYSEKPPQHQPRSFVEVTPRSQL